MTSARTLRTLALALGLSAIAFAAAHAGEPVLPGNLDENTRDAIVANAVRMEPGAAKNTGFLNLYIDHYTTDDELKPMLEVFAKQGQAALVAYWQKNQTTVGFARFANTLGYELRVARLRKLDDGKLRLIAVTDRPMSGFEVMRNLRSEDYPIAWIQIEFDANGKGEGQLIGAAQLTVKDGSLVIENFGVQPAKLLNPKVRKEKDKD